jgi:anti-sigma B factor antagonist
LERTIETFRIKAVPGDGACTLVLKGEADVAAADDIAHLGTIGLNDPVTHTLIIDMAELTFLDSSAIAALVNLRNLAEDSSKKLTLANVPARVLRVLTITGLSTLFTIDS